MPRPSTTILLISCPDQRGLIAAIASFVAEHGGNIVDVDQHTDSDTGQFFMRLEFEDGGVAPDVLRRDLEPLVQRHRMQLDVRRSDRRQRVALFVSRVDHCLIDLLWRRDAGEINADIPLIVSNHRDLEPIAARHGVAFHHFPMVRERKEEIERGQLALLRDQGIDLVVLARYMQILTPVLLDAYRHRVINIHHSFLPAFVGANPYRQAFTRGVKLIGATSHYATEDLDEGPIIEQDVVPITHRDGVDDLVRKGRDLERLVLSRAVRWHLADRVLAHQNRTVVFQ